MKPLASASATTAWVIVTHKPFYPLLVWWLVGDNVATSFWTLAAWPLFLAAALGARRWPFAARAGLPLAGLVDTAFSEVMFGRSSGVEAFFIPCAALAAMSFRADEASASRALTMVVFIVFATMRGLALPGLHPWPSAQWASVVSLNLYSAASLAAFVGLIFASARE
jgi:hypothetical protein